MRRSLFILFQVMPIVDLMAISNTHFQKLKDFITCSFPAGFPIKIEIPLFHVLNARVTFGNIFALANSIPGIQGEHLLMYRLVNLVEEQLISN